MSYRKGFFMGNRESNQKIEKKIEKHLTKLFRYAIILIGSGKTRYYYYIALQKTWFAAKLL